MTRTNLHLFEGFGVELEYMIVDKSSLAILPVADKIIHAVAEGYPNEVVQDNIAWSNELVLHVIELKTHGPAKSLRELPAPFYQNVKQINSILDPHNAILLPTGAHPFMNPLTETRLWPHEQNEIYEAYQRIFDCHGHGWANLQSVHLNLPFFNDAEFARLHTAVRLVLALFPAISASTPVLEGRWTGLADTRLEMYRTNQNKIPEISGLLIPERVYSQAEYEDKILKPMYAAIRPYDAKGTLEDEWLNSRGAIARFERNTIEVRTIDSQECVNADLALSALFVAVVRSLVEEHWCSFQQQKVLGEQKLSEILQRLIKGGESAWIEDPEFLQLFGYDGRTPVQAQTVWRQMIQDLKDHEYLESVWEENLSLILQKGTLSTRIRKAVGENIASTTLCKVYRQLSQCLSQNQMFEEA